MNDRSREAQLRSAHAPSDAGVDDCTRTPLGPMERQFVQELFKHYQFQLFGYLNGLLRSRDEAKDILQETYLRLLRQPNLDHVRENARAYLFQTALNLTRDHFRRKATHDDAAEREVVSAGGLDVPNWSSWPHLALEGEQTGQLIVDTLRSMKPCLRAALLLHRFHGLKHSEIASWMDVSERTVERYIKEGLSIITERLKGSL